MNAQDTLTQLIEKAKDFDSRKTDIVTDFGKAKAFGKAVAFGDIGPTPLTPHALAQLCDKLGGRTIRSGIRLPADFLQNYATDAEAEFLLNSRFGMVDASGGWRYMVRYSADTVRAVVAADYPTFGERGMYENGLMVDALASALKDMGGALDFRRCEITPDAVAIRVFVREFDAMTINSAYASSWAVGWYLGNNEIGDGKFTVAPCLKRTACDNSIVIPTESHTKLAHRGGKGKFTEAVGKAMLDVLPASYNALRRVVAAEKIGANIADEFAALNARFGWFDNKGKPKTENAQQIRDAFHRGTENSDTLMGVINGVTYAAHNVEMGEESQLAMELFAGALLERVPA